MAVNGTLAVRIARKRFPGDGRTPAHVAIEDLSFDVPRGQFCCIVGPSGCGKTTLLNIAAGLDSDVEGSVALDGTEGGQAPRVGYMFQAPRLLPWLSVRDNVDIVLDEEARAGGRGTDLLRQMDLGGFLDAYPGKLSGGMRRRVALARAFAIRPELLLLDEPFVSLDMPVGNRLRGMLLELWNAQPTTVLFVTHDLAEAVYLADRIVFLSRPPSRVVLDVEVDIPRPRALDNPALDAFRASLLDRHRTLLQGVVGSESGGRPAGQEDEDRGASP